MRAAYLRHYLPSDSNLYVNNLRIKCIKLPTTHLRNSVSEIIGVNKRPQIILLVLLGCLLLRCLLLLRTIITATFLLLLFLV